MRNGATATENGRIVAVLVFPTDSIYGYYGIVGAIHESPDLLSQNDASST